MYNKSMGPLIVDNNGEIKFNLSQKDRKAIERLMKELDDVISRWIEEKEKGETNDKMM